MADLSQFLSLSLPGYMEYRESWWEPLNDNFTKIDAWSLKTNQELVDARFDYQTLGEFLSQAHNPDGSLLPTAEMLAAENSPVYGFQDTSVSPATRYTLSQRVDNIDWELWYAREGQLNLRALQAYRQNPKDMILAGAGFGEGDGYPTWMGATGANVQIDGSTTPLWVSIGGRLGRVRTLKQVTLTGSAGTKYLYAEILNDDSADRIIVDGDAEVAPPSSPTGATSLDVDNNPIYFNDPAAVWQLPTNTVLPGDVLTLTSSNDKGKYLVKQVVSNNQLKIVGVFPVGGLGSINYKISDPLLVKLGFVDDVTTLTDSQLCIGEAYFNGTNVADFPSETGIKVKPRHFLDTFVSEWIEVDTTAGTPNLGSAIEGKFEHRFRHNLGSDKLDVTIQVSQADDGTAPIEELTMGHLISDLDVDVASTLGLNKTSDPVFVAPSHPADNFNAGGSGATYVQGTFVPGSLTGATVYTLTGGVTASLTGSSDLAGAVRCKWDRNSLWVKNSTLNRFYTDYDDNENTSGFIRVIVRKRG